MSATSSDRPASSAATRYFGRLQLLRLLGKSRRSMAWLVADPRTEQELMLVLPRVQPPDAAALERWQQLARQASRLSHPNLAAVVEIGVQDGWPYVAYDPREQATLADRVQGKALPGPEAAALMSGLLAGLAYAHEAGVAHHDLQPWCLLVDDAGKLRLAGLGAALEMPWHVTDTGHVGPSYQPALPGTRQAEREAAERDILAAGVLLHKLLAGAPPLDEPDVAGVVERLPPLGREILRLPWSLPQPVPEPLRAIVNRATDRQERQRYRSPRTLQRALEGWLQTEGDANGGPLALLSDRLRTQGALPAMPGAAARAARLALMERQRTNELAEVVLEDLALSFELLRLVNTAQVRGAQVSGAGPVLTVRRAIAMLGLDGVRRAALGLREWPGKLSEAGAAELAALIERCKRAGRIAMALRPAGYDGEVVYLITLMQNLGRLVVHHHFADEAQQIRRLMQPAPAAKPGDPDEPGMGEEGAAFAVLGADIEALGAAVARHWGLDESVLGMIRRLPADAMPRNPHSDDEILRAAASCGNEAADAMTQPPQRVAAALQKVVQRYGRMLDFDLRALQAAVQGQPQPEPIAVTMPAPLDLDDGAGGAVTRPGALRAAAARAGGAPR